jgi:hypothetical protein
MASTTTQSDEESIRFIMKKIMESVPTKDIPAMEAVCHPQGASVTMVDGIVLDRKLYKHLSDIVDFPGVPGEHIVDDKMDIKIHGKVAFAVFESDITSDGKLVYTAHNILVFHKSKVGEGVSEEWRLSVVADSLLSVTA